jgi:EAL domain-containing protein (putative c-di-GMP-specific phosphodiesterase class I)
VNISAQSVSDNAWCESLFLLLSTMPDVACRLVIEIAGTAPLEAVPGRAFVRRLHQLGCRVAVDNFGAGWDVWTGTDICSPDVVKIAGELLVGNGDRRTQGDELVRLVSLAREVAPCVVLKGVESACALDMACDAGVDCVQGYYVGGTHSLEVKVPQEPVCDSSTCDSVGKAGNEISLLPLAQLSNLVEQAELSADATGSRSGAAIERTVQLLERNAGMIVDKSVCCKLRNHAKLAYLTGLASSVYGKHSAIAATLRDEMAEVMRQEKGNPERSIQLLRCIGAFGRLHGQMIVCSFELDEAPGEL